jgi:hypothetical protein
LLFQMPVAFRSARSGASQPPDAAGAPGAATVAPAPQPGPKPEDGVHQN